MEARWKELVRKDEAGELDRDEERLFSRLVKTFRLLESNPRHSGLNSHDIEALSERYGRKVWQSSIENRKPAAGRLFWVYGPDKGEITTDPVSSPADRRSVEVMEFRTRPNWGNI